MIVELNPFSPFGWFCVDSPCRYTWLQCSSGGHGHRFYTTTCGDPPTWIRNPSSIIVASFDQLRSSDWALQIPSFDRALVLDARVAFRIVVYLQWSNNVTSQHLTGEWTHAQHWSLEYHAKNQIKFSENSWSQTFGQRLDPQPARFVFLVMLLRHLLLSSGTWGDVSEPVQARLHKAYLAFKSWCLEHKIACSQPAFQPKMETWTLKVTVFDGLDPFLITLSLQNGHFANVKPAQMNCLMSRGFVPELSCTRKMVMWRWLPKRTTDAWWCSGSLKR